MYVQLHLPIMISFTEYTRLDERFVNLLDKDEAEKHKHKHEVFHMLQKAYADQGGIHGSGFKSPDDMVKNIPFWKMHKKDGKVTSVSLYKDSQGRKRVAVASDGTEEGKKALGSAMQADFKQNRAHGEVSGKSLSFLKKQVHILDHARTYEEAQKYHAVKGDEIKRPEADDPEVKRHPELKDHFYQRKIGDEWHTKVLLGHNNKPIK